ncbi:hypothetical protein LCGC14_0901870 [marine sediment metagenome]|uniref:Uncharacterized protein n=1 Tax=marine sediment metagenome TaxID=412755 RepID=A0A0F9S343_9ZZZZ
MLMIEASNRKQIKQCAESEAVTHVMINMPTYLEKRGGAWVKKIKILPSAAKRLRGDQELVIRISGIPRYLGKGIGWDQVAPLDWRHWEGIQRRMCELVESVESVHSYASICLNAEVGGDARDKQGLDDLQDVGAITGAYLDWFDAGYFNYAIPARLGNTETAVRRQADVICKIAAPLTGQIVPCYWLDRVRHAQPGEIIQLIADRGRTYNTAVAIGDWLGAFPPADRWPVYIGPRVMDLHAILRRLR